MPDEGGVTGGALPMSAGTSFHGRRKPNGSACQRRTMWPVGVEVALRREARLAERAPAQPDLAVAIGIIPVDERDLDLGAVEQPGAHLVLDDAALSEHPHQVEIVGREPGIAPDRVRSKPASAR